MFDWLFNLFKDNDSNPLSLTEGAQIMVFAPVPGTDKKKMIKQLQTFFGSNNKYVIDYETLGEIGVTRHLPSNLHYFNHDILKDMDVAYSLLVEHNRGRNGNLVAVISEEGVEKIEKKLDDFYRTVNGWMVFRKFGKDVKGVYYEHRIESLLKQAPTHYQHSTVDIPYLPEECPNCEETGGRYHIRWGEEVCCPCCGWTSISIDDLINHIEEVEEAILQGKKFPKGKEISIG